MKKNTLISFILLGAVVGCYMLIARLESKKSSFKDKDKETTMPKKLPSEKVTLDSGLSYEVLEYGDGQTTPKPGQLLTVHYTGWLNDGNDKPMGDPFDSSHGTRREPIKFYVGRGQVIRGWDEGLLQMRKGDKYRLFIPPQLAYGKQGVPGVIPSNASLIFDVELLSIE